MERYNRIIQNEEFKKLMSRLNDIEKDRIFCRHDITHLLDVARVAYIMVLEEGLDVPKDIVYAVGLLHDIGRVMHYDNGEEHHIASAGLAEKIMSQCDYTDEEIAFAAAAIKNHREIDLNADFNRILYKADKLSRNCFACKAIKECKWEAAKKNKGVV